MELSSSARTLWAKTPGYDHDQVDQRLWLSLVQHCRDSADVAQLLYEYWLPKNVRNRIDKASGGYGVELATWCAGLHDIGKGQYAFQSQISGTMHAWQWEKVRELPETLDIDVNPLVPKPHSIHSELILRRMLASRWPDSKDMVQATLTAAAGAHHGKPSRCVVDRTERSRAEAWLEQHGSAWCRLWDEIFEDIMERTGAKPALDYVLAGPGLSAADQLVMAGLVTVSDWIASNQDLFELTTSGMHSSSESRAENALEKLDLTCAWDAASTPPQTDVHSRFGWPAGASLRPAQAAAMDVVHGMKQGPALVIMELETGGGKSELALLAAEVLAARSQAGGVAFALPTMATSDAMFTRVKRWVDAVSRQDGQLHTLFLGHSRAQLNQAYENLISKNTREIDGFSSTSEHTSEAVIAHRWLIGSRRGLLSEFVVCTVDQILMSALATKHVALRHLGLSGKVVIVDEVHSYDVYSSSYLHKALEWLAAQGVSVILLSATLASGQRKKLEDAYKKGLGDTQDYLNKSAPRSRRVSLRSVPKVQENVDVEKFPRITTVQHDGAVTVSLPDRPGHRIVKMRAINDDMAEIIKELSVVRQDGGVVGIMCNTVARAQDVYKNLSREYGLENVELLHSQFTAADRALREQNLMSLIGPDSHRGAGRPYMRFVVGTQVLEQSLDIDFDLLVTDLAPTDAIAQRAGRLHRHQRPVDDRPEVLREPVMLVRGFGYAGVVPEPDSGAEAIYGKKILLDTFAVLEPLFSGGVWCLRHDVPHHVEQTYASPAQQRKEWAEVYAAACIEAEEKENSARFRAHSFQLKPVKKSLTLQQALQAMTPQDTERSETSAQAHVRDIQPTLEVLLVQAADDGTLRVLPWLAEDDPRLQVSIDPGQVPSHVVAKAIARSAVRLPQSLASAKGQSLELAIAELEAQTPVAWSQHYVLKGQLMLTINEELIGNLCGKTFRYDPEVGIEVMQDFPKNHGGAHESDDI